MDKRKLLIRVVCILVALAMVVTMFLALILR
jgi:hypothetical protein